MSATEWTTERFDALPEGTVIEWLESGVELMAVKQEKGRWHLAHRTYYEYPEGIVEDADPGSIRVVSVPIDALLADETVLAAAECIEGYEAARHEARGALRAAVAHVTGETQ